MSQQYYHKISGNMIIVNQKQVSLNIKEHLKNLAVKSCGFNGFTTPSNPNDNGYFVMWIINNDHGRNIEQLSGGNIGKALQIIEDNADKEIIQAFYTLIEYKSIDVSMVFDVCTNEKYRKKGIMKKLFKKSFNSPQGNRWYLGVDLNNNMFDVLIKFYVGLGFENPLLTNLGPDKTNHGLYFISLYKTPNSMQPTKDASKKLIKIIEKMKNLYFDMMNKYKIVLDSKSVHSIYQQYVYSDVKFEVGGILDINKNINNTLILDINPTDIFKGSVGEVYLIDWSSNLTKFTFHTHPKNAYIKHNVLLGWPSDFDMKMIFDNQEQMLVHFIFSLEAIYGIQISPMFRFIYVLLPSNCKKILSDSIQSYFHFILKDRNDVKHGNIIFLERSKNLDIQTLKQHPYMSPIKINELEQTINKSDESNLIKIFNNLYFDLTNNRQVNSGIIDMGFIALRKDDYEPMDID